MNTILQFRKRNKENNNVYCNELSRDDSLRQKKTAATALKTSDQVLPRPILKKKKKIKTLGHPAASWHPIPCRVNLDYFLLSAKCDATVG